VTESDQTTQSFSPAPESGAVQPAESSAGGQGLEAAPTDNGWLKDMEAIRGSGGQGESHRIIVPPPPGEQ
jgi:hypothetical protein